MANCRSYDLRKRVVDYVLSGGQIVAASRLFQVSEKSIHRWLILYKIQGDLKPKTASVRNGYKIDHEAVASYFAQYPHATLKEAADVFSTYQSVIWNICKKLKITRKKRARIAKNAAKRSAENS